MDQSTHLNAGLTRLFNHQLYELSKGIRPLSMLTVTKPECDPVVRRLMRDGVAYYLHEACATKVSVLFGRPAAVAAARRFLTKSLCKLSPEHDFMLGILLGYDREQQCVRYIERLAIADKDSVMLGSDFCKVLPNWLDATVDEATPDRVN